MPKKYTPEIRNNEDAKTKKDFPYEVVVIAETEDGRGGFTVGLFKYLSVADFVLEELKEMTDEEIEDIAP